VKIKELTLSGFERLSLNSIKKITIKPEAKIQIILGTNGSGKSSLISELSPLPAVSSNYLKTGYKNIIISHNSKNYTLKSDFSSSHVHSFKVDDVELNEGGTVTVQKELVKYHFGLTQEIHELLTGVEKFTNMSSARRRDWFTKLCETNYDYAISVYNKIKEKNRDISGAIKIAKKRLVQEISKLPDDKQIIELEQKLNGKMSFLDNFYQLRTQNSYSDIELDENVYRKQQELIKVSKQLISLINGLGNTEYVHLEEINEYIEELSIKLNTEETKYKIYLKDHEDQDKKYQVFKSQHIESVGQISKKIEGCEKGINELRKVLKIDTEHKTENPKNVRVSLENIHSDLITLLNELPQNINKQYSLSALNNLKDKKIILSETKNNIHSELSKLLHKKQHMLEMKDGDKTQCPKCNHSWVIGYSDEAYNKLLGNIEHKEKEFVKISSDLNKLEEEIKDIEEYASKYRQLTSIMRSIPEAKVMWSYIVDNDLINQEPKSIIIKIDHYLSDLNKIDLIENLQSDLKDLLNLKELADKSNDSDIEQIKKKVLDLETELGNINKAIHNLRLRKNEAVNFANKLKDIDRLKSVLENLLKTNNELLLSKLEQVKNNVVNEQIRLLLIDVSCLRGELNDLHSQKNIVNDIQNQLKVLEVQEKASKLLLNELSPTNGLIAEGLLGFIKNYTKKMNILISKIWTYPMEIKDCGSTDEDGTELDYKFPVKVKNKDKDINDVSLCSTGMKEIIDLSFKIVAYLCLKIQEYPLFLDELGATMDTEHKNKVVNLIKYLNEEMHFSQIFIVSHDYGQYGALGSLQTCVICPDNIIKPKVYNEHVTIN